MIEKPLNSNIFHKQPTLPPFHDWYKSPNGCEYKFFSDVLDFPASRAACGASRPGSDLAAMGVRDGVGNDLE